jgi:LmbE family N-acetylglucosaminyl deacetylase
VRLRLEGAQRAVVVAPHPDDEIIGAAGLVQILRRRGCTVRVIVVSDGGASHPVSQRWPAKRLIAARRAESLRALLRLGVVRHDVTFLDLPDGALLARQAACHGAVHRALRQHGKVDLLVGPTRGDGHPDHRAVASALRSFPGAHRSLGYQVWPPQRRSAGTSYRVVMPGGAAAKRSLIRVHRTQLGAITDDPAGFSIARHELDAFSYPIEYFADQRR